MKKAALLLLLLIAQLAFAQSAGRLQRIDSVLTYLHERHLFNGAVLLAEDGKVTYQKTMGLANAETGEPLTPASAFNLASISKQFYTMMVMILQEQGKLDYDDRVQKHLPLFPYADITIRQLMNQVSGLPEYFELADRDMNLLDTLTNQSLLELLARKQPPLVFAPGDQWQYCNTNYTVLASLIEKVSGTGVDQFLRQSITGPLDMRNTYVYNLKMRSYPKSRVFGLRYEGGLPVEYDLTRFDGIVGDGNIYASSEDLLKWDQALYTDKLVKQATFQEAITPGKLNDGQMTRYGFGWALSPDEKVVSHTGGWVGFRNIIVRYLDKKQTLVVLTSGSNGIAMHLVKNILEEKPVNVPATQLITNVQIIDGTGLPAYAANVRIVDDRIAEIGALEPAPGETVTDGQGRILAPGFIDSHSHHDWGLRENPACIAATNQGITTIVVGQDGGSQNMDSIRVLLAMRPVSVNIASFTGHATLREQAMRGDVLRKATDEEIAAMQETLSREMEKGSLGLSTGLEYEEAFYSNRDEVIALAKTAAAHNGLYISHIRSEDVYQDEAIDEILDIGREAGIPVQISHFKIALRSNWGGSAALLRKLQSARQQGVDVSADVYPYAMWSSTPRVLFPQKDFDNPESALFAARELFDPAASVMVRFPANTDYEGKTVSEIGVLHGETPAEALLRIIREGEAAGQSGAIVATSMSETDIANFLRWEHASICSDGAMSGHPRGHGAFTRVLGRYVREQEILSLEEAIHKMTALPAEKLGIQNRGLIAPGYFADLVLFDPATVGDNATIEAPRALSSGIEKVWVNGRAVYEGQRVTAAYPGVLVGKTE